MLFRSDRPATVLVKPATACPLRQASKVCVRCLVSAATVREKANIKQHRAVPIRASTVRERTNGDCYQLPIAFRSPAMNGRRWWMGAGGGSGLVNAIRKRQASRRVVIAIMCRPLADARGSDRSVTLPSYQSRDREGADEWRLLSIADRLPVAGDGWSLAMDGRR